MTKVEIEKIVRKVLYKMTVEESIDYLHNLLEDKQCPYISTDVTTVGYILTDLSQ